MNLQQVLGPDIAFTAAGHLANFGDWNETVAQRMAAAEGLDLNDCHWAAIRFLREFYVDYGVAASPRVMIHEVGQQLGEARCTYKHIKELFPNGGIRQACRIAGLPDYYCNAC